MMNLKGTIRNVVYPFDVYKRDAQGEIAYIGEDPEVDIVGTVTSRIISVLVSITAVNAALEEAVGVSIKDLLGKIF